MGRVWLPRPYKPKKKVFLFACLLCKYCAQAGQEGAGFKNTHHHQLLCIPFALDLTHREQTALSSLVRMKLTSFSRGDTISQPAADFISAPSLFFGLMSYQPASPAFMWLWEPEGG